MAVLGRLLIGSQQRIDLPDFLSLQSYVASDFKELIRSFVGDRALILKGFEIIDAPQAIGTSSVSIKVSDSVLYSPTSSAGSFFFGLPEGDELSAPLVPELRTNATNYVYITLSTTGTAQDTRAFWDVDLNGGQGGEFNQDINTEGVLIAQVGVSTSGFPDGTIPIAAIEYDSTSITNITDSRNMMFRLGSGGVSPNPNATFQFPPLPSSEYARNEPPSTIQNSASPSPFFGGDKNIQTLKDWMDAVMTKLLELSGTTYWYETTQALNLVNIFDDALGSSLKSKGRWTHSETTPGLVTWSEDIVYRKMNDNRDIIVRSNPTTGVQLGNEQVMWIQMLRNESINPLDTPVQFSNGVTYVNGAPGDFSNLSLGDWVKRRGDNENLYVRVVGFKTGTSGGGSDTTSPSLAASIILENAYAGSTALDTAVYTKGVYENSDVKTSDRDDTDSYSAGGDFYWLANRSDTIMDIGSIAATYLTDVDVSDSDGKRAKLNFSSAHGLADGDRIVLANAGAYNGTYQVEVESTTVVNIETTATTNPSNITVSWAIVTTQARDVGSQGFEIESASHGFTSNQTVIIADTATAYDTYNGGKYLINVRSNSTFQVPFDSNVNVGAVGAATGAKVILKTELGAIEVIQGESIDINKPDAVNIMQFVGMESLSQNTPNYFLPQNYNALAGFANYNADATDNLTQRAAKLTAMMADRVQDRDTQIAGRVTVRNETSGSTQLITFTGNLQLIIPGTGRHDIAPPGGSFYLGAYKALTVTFNRNVSYQSITAQVESFDESFQLSENKIILLYRFAETDVYTWDGSAISKSSSWTSNDYDTGQNKNIVVHDEAGVKYTSSGYLYYGSAGYVRIVIPGTNINNNVDTGAINALYPTGFAVGNDYSVWVRVNRTASKTFNTVATSASYQDSNVAGALYVTSNADVPTDQDTIVLYTVKSNTLIKLHHDTLYQIGNIYEEDKIGVSGSPSNTNQFLAPISSGAVIYLPYDSRNYNSIRNYIVGSGQLEVFLNGQKLRKGEDYNEYGTLNTLSTQIQTLQTLVVGDVLSFRIGSVGGVYTAPSDPSTITLQQAYDHDPQILLGSQAPVKIKASGQDYKPLTSPNNVALSIAGDLAVSGVIDPTGIVFTPQAASPLGVGESGIWIDTGGNLNQVRAGGSPASVDITTSIINATSALANPSTFLTAGSGIDISAATISAKLDAAGAITSTVNGLKVAVDNSTIQIQSNQLAVVGVPRTTSSFTNNTGSPIAAGAVVAADSASGTIKLASANNLSNAIKTIGVTLTTIPNGGSGLVCTGGAVTIATTGFSSGVIVYLSSTTPGQATDVKPTTYGAPIFAIGTSIGSNLVIVQPKLISIVANTYREIYVQTGALLSGNSITLPVDSRDSGAIRYYVVGQGMLNVYLNGQLLEINNDYLENGSIGADSNTITINQDLVDGDRLQFVISSNQALARAVSSI